MTRILSVVASVVMFGATLGGSSIVAAQTKPAKEKAPEPPPLPAPQARLWLIAPTPTGPWMLRIQNEGTIALRVPADARLLRLEVMENAEAKPVICEAPKALRPSGFPEDRALLLAPGQVYEEHFDPRLLCFGKNAAVLKNNAVVYSRFGWDPPKPKDKKPVKGPFAVESTEREPTIASLHELRAPAILLAEPYVPPPTPAPASSDQETSATEGASPPAPPPPPVDERAGRIEVSSTGFVEASAPRTISVTVTAKNVGMRSITVALRPWMLTFDIQGPHGHWATCYGDTSRRALPADAFRPLAAGASTTFTVLLAEVCPKNTFPRPGVYSVTTTLDARGTADGVDAYTAKVRGQQPSLIRLTSGEEPYFVAPPKATTMPKPNMDEGDEK